MGVSVFFLMDGSIYRVTASYSFREDFEAGPKTVATKMERSLTSQRRLDEENWWSLGPPL